MPKAAFFDVDGTLARTNIVSPYARLRWNEISWLARIAWAPLFAVKAARYAWVDLHDRSQFNRIFYRNYRSRPVSQIETWGRTSFEQYLKPRLFPEAVRHIETLHTEGFAVVLVTGSLDLFIRPLAEHLGVHHILATQLQVRDGRFTGELDGDPVSDLHKARLIQEFAARYDLDLGACQAYGDSMADLPMLESVGSPHAVNPSRRLRLVAQERSWTVHDWTLDATRPRAAEASG